MRRVGGTVAGGILVIGILKGMARVVVDFYVDFLPLLLHGRFEFVNIIRRDSLIEASE